MFRMPRVLPMRLAHGLRHASRDVGEAIAQEIAVVARS